MTERWKELLTNFIHLGESVRTLVFSLEVGTQEIWQVVLDIGSFQEPHKIPVHDGMRFYEFWFR